LKRVSNSYSARTVSALNYGPTAAERYLWWVPRMPNYVWLAMIVMALFALSVSTLMRSWEQEREARASYTQTQTRVENARGLQRDLKERTGQIRSDPQVAAQVAQDQLRLVRANEVVVAVP
jgi:membrane protein implicated in regulation of membrane protease activity